MEKIGDIMERLGFNAEAGDSVKAAFLQNLIKQAYGVDVPIPEKFKTSEEKAKDARGAEQLGFNLDAG